METEPQKPNSHSEITANKISTKHAFQHKVANTKGIVRIIIIYNAKDQRLNESENKTVEAVVTIVLRRSVSMTGLYEVRNNTKWD